MELKNRLAQAWHSVLALPNQTWDTLHDKLGKERQSNTVFPPEGSEFAALNAVQPHRVRVLILGQDPYPKQTGATPDAQGMAFSVPFGVAVPASLRNVYREMHDDLGQTPAQHGCLLRWAEQGVLLLNTSLSVRRGESNSHADLGWHEITGRVIEYLASRQAPLAVLCWGNPARHTAKPFEGTHHFVLHCAHPSPLSASRGFFGSRHFSKVNAWLEESGQDPVDWRVVI